MVACSVRRYVTGAGVFWTDAGRGSWDGRRLFFGDDIAAGNSTASLIAVFGPMTVAFIAYFIAQALRKSQGIDVSLAYKEIPVE